MAESIQPGRAGFLLKTKESTWNLAVDPPPLKDTFEGHSLLFGTLGAVGDEVIALAAGPVVTYGLLQSNRKYSLGSM